MDLSNLSFVDIETTGASPATNRIIEIGILRESPLSYSMRFCTAFASSKINHGHIPGQ